ncbi:NYN domain-containing protein [Ilyonectria destructans]|nr:NYN domain-containing protein [Ilyonectria destructans]
MSSETTIRLAVLIDADNATPKSASPLLAEIAKYGTAFVRRAYGDWTGTTLTGWKEQLLTQSIQPVQQFPYTHGKNATDSAMIIDAMDLLYTNRFDGFCIVSSDSDFTRLAARIRESGLVVYGFGERKTPAPFVKACDKFIYIENILPEKQDRPGVLISPGSPQSHQRTPSAKIQIESVVKERLQKAIEASSDEAGWANLAKVGSLITKQYPEFDPRTYGFNKLGHLVSKLDGFETEQRSPGEGKPMVMYARATPA